MQPPRTSAVVALATTLIAPLAAGAPAPASAPARAVLKVDAGALDRKDSPVRFALPEGMPAAAGGGGLELRDGAGRRLPLQIDAAGKQAFFLLPALARGKQASYQIVDAGGGAAPAAGAATAGAAAAAAAAAGLEVRREADHLVVTVAGAPLLHFRTAVPAAPAGGAPARHLRAGYLHPVMSPAGAVVTDDSPADHRHHHGIWTGWTVTEYEGKRLGFWGAGASQVQLTGVTNLFSGPVAGGFTARIASSDDGVEPPRHILDSEWKLVALRVRPGAGKAPYFLFDLEWTDTVVGTKPLQLLEYRYGGLGVRGPAAWLDPTAVTFLTSEGDDRLAGENTRVRWVHLGGPVARAPGARRLDASAGLAVLVHPMNQRAPEPVRLNPGIPELCLSPVKAGPMTLAPGRPYTARYRFVVADGPANRALLERLWRDYARAPIVKVEPAAAPKS